MALKYFSAKELQCKGTGVLKLAPGFGEALDELRELWGKPLIVTSCCRDIGHNKKVGGAANSFHVFNKPEYIDGIKNPYHTPGTCAADIKLGDSREYWLFAKMAMEKGFSVGVNKAFIHVDLRAKYTNLRPALFTY